MRKVGCRKERLITKEPSERGLLDGAILNETFQSTIKSTWIVRGIYRFKDQDAANRHQEEALYARMKFIKENSTVVDN